MDPSYFNFLLKIRLPPIVFATKGKSTISHVWLYMIALISLLIASFQNGATGEVIASL